ncbi:hypothetical protein AAVH_28272 [Aphelenchoides avenae]|nr:hypothetical protein AAVH_28272 [Aphelenchus avenae]
MPKVNFSPEDVCGWLHAKSQWKDGARVLTFYVGTPKEAVDVAKNVIKAFEGDKEPHTYELFLHGGGDAVEGIQHTAFSNATGDNLSVSSIIGALFLKRSDHTYYGEHRPFKSALGAFGQSYRLSVEAHHAYLEMLAKSTS